MTNPQWSAGRDFIPTATAMIRGKKTDNGYEKQGCTGKSDEV
jgi:hypothetical protein